MIDLADADLLHVWETMRRESLPRRTAAVLALTSPESTIEEITGLSLGESMRRMLQLRIRSFGPRLACVADCEACGAAFEFELDAHELSNSSPPRPEAESLLRLDRDGCRVELRLPTLGDCIAVADAADAEEAYHELLQRCVAGVSPEGRPMAADALPGDWLQAADEQIAAADASAEWLLALACPACGRESAAPFDPASFCWSEIEARAPRLLAEVHALASRYGWHEADILAMSRLRRARYLEMVLS